MLIQTGEQYCFRISAKSSRNIGYFEVWQYKDKYKIWSLRIIESQRNKGYGTRMLKEFLQEFKADKPLFLHVYKTNKIAIHMYEKLGFVIVGEYGDDAWTMQYRPCS